MSTILTEVEGTLNSRPTTYVYDEVDVHPLTPSHLVYGRSLTQLADNLHYDDYDEPVANYEKRFRYLTEKPNPLTLDVVPEQHKNYSTLCPHVCCLSENWSV